MNQEQPESIQNNQRNDETEQTFKEYDWPIPNAQIDCFEEKCEEVKKIYLNINAVIDVPVLKERIQFSTLGKLAITDRRLVWWSECTRWPDDQKELVDNQEDQEVQQEEDNDTPVRQTKAEQESRKRFNEDRDETASKFITPGTSNDKLSNDSFNQWNCDSDQGNQFQIDFDKVVGYEIKEKKLTVFTKNELDKFDQKRDSQDFRDINYGTVWATVKQQLYAKCRNFVQTSLFGRAEVTFDLTGLNAFQRKDILLFIEEYTFKNPVPKKEQ